MTSRPNTADSPQLPEREELNVRLRESEELFRLLVVSVKEYAIFLLDPEGRIATWNTGAQRIKGYLPEEIIGKHFSVFYPHEDIKARKPERELAEAIARGSMEDEGWRLRKDSTRFWANVVITALFDAEGVLRGFAKVTRDITDRKRAEETQRTMLEARLKAEEERRAAENTVQLTQEANRAKDDFLMTLSHELRTPMTSILGWARMLQTIPPTDPSFREAITAINVASELQAQLIDDVLDVSQIMSGKLRLKVEKVDVITVIGQAIETVQPTAAAKSISIKVALSQDLGSINADATRMQQVLWNLLANAVKFTPRNGAIEIQATRTDSQLQIAVCDTGKGIGAEFLPHVFDAFRQAEEPVTRVHGGLGLGLSIVRYLVEAHGGMVTAESNGAGLGSKFTVTLPVA